MRNISLRAALEANGVTDEDAIRRHMDFVLQTEERAGRKLDISRYRPNPANPNLFPPMMG